MRRIASHLTGAIIEGALISLLVIGLIAAPAFAAPGGNPNRGGSTGASLAFDPSTVSVGQQYTVVGSGFRADTWVAIGARYTDTTWWGSAVSDGQGTVRITFTASSPGEVLHDASEQGRNGSLRWKTSATLTVSP